MVEQTLVRRSFSTPTERKQIDKYTSVGSALGLPGTCIGSSDRVGRDRPEHILDFICAVRAGTGSERSILHGIERLSLGLLTNLAGSLHRSPIMLRSLSLHITVDDGCALNLRKNGDT